jgi:hypothetical protein
MKLSECALAMASYYFANHGGITRRVIAVGGGFEPTDFLKARSPEGKELLAKLLYTLDEIDKLIDSAGLNQSLQQRTMCCRQLCSDDMPFLGTFDAHNGQFKKWLELLIVVAEKLPDKTPGEVLLVADTNALIKFPDIENWAFSQFPTFTIVVPSTTVGELDSFANSNKSQEVKDVSKKLVRQFKGYRDRNRDAGLGIMDPVVIVRDRITLRFDPREPVFPATLNWLNSAQNDDKQVARVIGLSREHPQCIVALVTSDFNAQTKAALAGVEFIEPPIKDESA